MSKKKRSDFERKVAASLTRRGIRYSYEPHSFEYYKKVYKPLCLNCGSSYVVSIRSYTPDFLVKDCLYLEAKGKLAASERKKLLDVKSANPDLDLRLVFMRDNKITKRSKKRYSDWAEENGFPWAIGEPPDEWF